MSKYCFQCYDGEDFDTGIIYCEGCRIHGRCKMECDTCSEHNQPGCPEFIKLNQNKEGE